jgi:hypothetical protein
VNHVIYDVNLTGNDYVVGDIHGCVTILYAALAKINFDFAKDRLFSVGDLVDRGPENLLVEDLIYQDWFHFVKGNHDLMVLDAIESDLDAYYWQQSGGAWACDLVAKYGKSTSSDDLAFENIVNKIKQAPDIISVKQSNGTYFHVSHTLFDIPYFVRSFDDFCDYVNAQNIDREFYWDRGPMRVYFNELLDDAYINQFKIDDNYKNNYKNKFYIGHTTTLHPVTYFNWCSIDTSGGMAHNYSQYGFTLAKPLTNEYYKDGNLIVPIKLDR